MHVLQEIRKNLTSRLGGPAVVHRLQKLEQEAINEICSTLDSKQKAVLNPTGWLLYGGRGTGRSWVMACAAIINAINNPDMAFRIYDHISDKHMIVDHTFAMVDRILDRLPSEVRCKFVLRRKPVHTIEYRLRKE